MWLAAFARSTLHFRCIFVACSCMLVAQQLPPATDLSLPGRPLVLNLYLGDLHVMHRDTAIDGGGVRIVAEGSRGVILSAVLETVPAPLTSTQCRDQRWPKMKNVPMRYEHLRFSEHDGMALVEYEVPEFQGKPVHQQSMFAFLAAQGLCAVVHVSKGNFQPRDEEYMAELINGARLEPPNPAAVSGGADTYATSVGGLYPSQITIDIGQGSDKSRPQSPSAANHVGTAVSQFDKSGPPPKSKLPAVRGRKIYFIAIGDFPGEQVQQLVQHYREKFNLDIQTLTAIPIDSSAIDPKRQQLVAERLITSVRAAFPKLANDPTVILIGFTSTDMYPLSMNWSFALGWRVASTRTAVVSTARMDLHYPGELSGSAFPETRLQKIVTKDIGILYYGLPQSNDPRSVLYGQILGIQELDAVSEEF